MTRNLVTCTGSVGLTLAAPEGVTVDAAKRTISGLAVPYGKPGRTGMGVLSFRQGSLSWSDPKRVKLLVEHNQGGEVVGYATELSDTPAGLLATFHVPAGPAGDAALASAAAGLRDGLSVGVQVDDATAEKLRRQAGRPGVVEASGHLRETSLVSVPAFDDARIDSVAAGAGHLVVSSWADSIPEEGNTMRCSSCGNVHALGVTCPTVTAGADDLVTAAANKTTDNKPADNKPADNKPADNKPADNQPAADQPVERPAVVQAAAGMAVAMVTSEPSQYAFGDAQFGAADLSLLSDAARVAFDGDPEARQRIARFNSQLAAGNPASVMALAAVAQTTDMPADVFNPQGYRPDLLQRAVDAGRPIVSRLSRVPISNATPFSIPSTGQFAGVGDHTEGTASVADGTLGLGGDVVTPKAVSGSYRLSRELVDSSNPAIDRIAGDEMLRNYRRISEDKVIAAIVAADAAVTLSVDTVVKLQGELIDFIDDDGQGADFVAMSRTFAKTMGTDLDADGRPLLNRYGQSINAPGKAGSAGYEVEGSELVRAFRMATDTAALIRAAGVLFAESATQQFRFEQAEGPGIIKLALWGYVGAKVLPDRIGGLPNITRVTISAT